MFVVQDRNDLVEAIDHFGDDNQYSDPLGPYLWAGSTVQERNSARLFFSGFGR